MAGEAALGRAVLELSTDDKKLDAGLADVPKKVKKTGEAVKELAGPLRQVNGLLATFGVGLSVGAVVAFGKSILDLADNVTKVHDRTGLATDDVQRLQFIAEQSGNSIDDLAGSISKLQIRLADGKARKGIENLGLDFQRIRESSPYDALAAVADAIGKIENPTLRAQRAVEVFGKAGTEILPTLVSNFKELGDAAPVMSEETVAALDAAGDAIAKFGSTLKVWAAESYNYARGFFDKLVAEAYRMVQRLYENAAGLAALAAKLPGASKLGIDQTLVASLKESAVWYKNVAAAMETTTVAAKKTAPAVAALPPVHERAAKGASAHAKATKDAADAMAALTEKVKWGADGLSSFGFEVDLAIPQIDALGAASRRLGEDITIGFAGLEKIGDELGSLTLPAVRQGLFRAMFGSPAEFGQKLGATLMGAIQGGGNIFNAAGGMIGNQLGTSIAGKLSASLLKDGAGMLSKALGGLLQAVLPGVGALLGPLLGKAWDGIKKLFGGGREGRKLVETFIAENFGNASELQRQLLELGPAYDRLWRGLTQLGDNASTEEAQRAIEAVTEALAANKQKAEEAADAAETGAADMAAAQAAAADEIRARYAESFKAIDDEYKKLSDSVAAEAEEAEMGIQERRDRARMQELEKQRAALEQQQATEIAAKEETFGQVLEAGRQTRGELDQIFGGEPIRIPYEFVPRNALPDVIPMAAGGFGRITRPTLFYSGGDEDYAFSGEGRSFGLGALAARPIVIEHTTNLDGRVVARNQVRHIPNDLARVGVRSR